MKVWLIVAACLVIAGLILFAVVMTANSWDFTKLSTSKYETHTYCITDDFSDISIKTKTADITFVYSDDGQTKIICFEPENSTHSVKTEGGALNIELAENKKWYEYIGINFNTSTITVCLPFEKYGSLKIESSTGNTKIPDNFEFQSIDICASTGNVTCLSNSSEDVRIKLTTGDIFIDCISAKDIVLVTSTGKTDVSSVECRKIDTTVSTGKTNLSNIRCESLSSCGNTGDMSLISVVASGNFSIERSTGDISFDGCDAGEIFVKTDTGNVTGSLLSEKIFITETDTGHEKVPKSVNGGRCEITTDTGNIEFIIKK